MAKFNISSLRCAMTGRVLPVGFILSAILAFEQISVAQTTASNASFEQPVFNQISTRPPGGCYKWVGDGSVIDNIKVKVQPAPDPGVGPAAPHSVFVTWYIPLEGLGSGNCGNAGIVQDLTSGVASADVTDVYIAF